MKGTASIAVSFEAMYQVPLVLFHSRIVMQPASLRLVRRCLINRIYDNFIFFCLCLVQLVIGPESNCVASNTRYSFPREGGGGWKLTLTRLATTSCPVSRFDVTRHNISKSGLPISPSVDRYRRKCLCFLSYSSFHSNILVSPPSKRHATSNKAWPLLAHRQPWQRRSICLHQARVEGLMAL